MVVCGKRGELQKCLQDHPPIAGAVFAKLEFLDLTSQECFSEGEPRGEPGVCDESRILAVPSVAAPAAPMARPPQEISQILRKLVEDNKFQLHEDRASQHPRLPY